MSKKYPINLQGLSTEANTPVGRFADSQPWAEAIANIHQINVGGEKAFHRRSRNSRWNVDPQR